MKIDFGNDFWDGFSPVLVKELRQGLRSGWFARTYLITQVLLCLMVVFQASNALSASKQDEKQYSDIVGGFYWTIMSFVLFLRAPIQGLNGVSQEVQGRTLELLALTRQTSRKLLWGKWLSVMIQSLLLVLSLLPYGMIRYYFGQINISDELGMILLLSFCSGVMVALGLGISALPGLIKAAIAFGVFIMASVGSSSFIRSTGIWGLESLSWIMIVGGGLLMIIFFLELGASWIAPISENTALRLRLCGIAGWCWVGLAKCFGLPKEMVISMAVIAGIVTVYLFAEGLRDCRKVQWAHVRYFLSWPKGIRWISVFFYPGWQSAVLYAVLLLGVFGGSLSFFVMRDSLMGFLILTLVMITTLGFPMLLMSRSWWRWGKGFWNYWSVQVLLTMPLVFLMPATIISKNILYAVLPFPPGSLILAFCNSAKGTFGSKDLNLSEHLVGMIAAYSGFIFCLLIIFSRSYWKGIREMKNKQESSV